MTSLIQVVKRFLWGSLFCFDVIKIFLRFTEMGQESCHVFHTIPNESLLQLCRNDLLQYSAQFGRWQHNGVAQTSKPAKEISCHSVSLTTKTSNKKVTKIDLFNFGYDWWRQQTRLTAIVGGESITERISCSPDRVHCDSMLSMLHKLDVLLLHRIKKKPNQRVRFSLHVVEYA